MALLTAFAGSAPPLSARGPLAEVIVLLNGEESAVEARLARQIPQAHIRWRYRVVLNGMALVLPHAELAHLRRLPGIADVYPSVRYSPTLYTSPGAIGAPALWGGALETAGNGVKIGIIDDGVDRTHPFFSPRGYQMPPGYPKGQRRFTSAKVIVARAFAPRSTRWRYARRPYDPTLSAHATHVGGIAAGNHRTSTGEGFVSGVAPKAYIGNYKVLSVPTGRFGLNGNSPEIIAGIEAAVRDGMDVINLSLGQAEIEPDRDLVARAIDGAAAAGVVPVVSAGNDFLDLGNGSIASPGSADRAITVAAGSTRGPTLASFSSGGPSPMSLRLKPDVTAPGLDIISSVPRREGLWAPLSGTSMAAPHVAGAAALLRQRHRGWTVAQLKSALVQTGSPVARSSSSAEAPVTRAGGGSVNLPKADTPLLFAEPSGVSFGYVSVGASSARRIALSDAGGGAGAWSAAVESQATPSGTVVSVPPVSTVPGELIVTVTASRATGNGLGYIVLTRGAERRRIPYWFRVNAPALAGHRVRVLTRPGTYRASTRGQPSLVETYRYPENPSPLGVTRVLRGPERVYRIRLARPAANLGVVILGRRSKVEPRIVRAGDENRLLGSVALPYVANPYLGSFGSPALVVGATSPAAGDYDIVFDSATPAGAGTFTFRYWLSDTSRPRLRLLTPTVRPGGLIRIAAVDRGSGVNPASVRVTVGGRVLRAQFDPRRRSIVARVPSIRPGRRVVEVRVSDFQEYKNQENVARILPNTSRLRARLVVR